MLDNLSSFLPQSIIQVSCRCFTPRYPMNYRHYVAILIYSLALMACGAKQTPDTDKGPAVDQVISNEPFEDVHLQRTLRFRDLLRSEEHTSELQSRRHLVCPPLLA